MDAHQIGEWQSCQRLWRLSRDWHRLRWHPKRLFDALLRRGILAISNAIPVDTTIMEARAQYMQSAANPGLDVSTDPYRLARDWCALLDVLLRSVARQGVPKALKEHPPVRLNSLTAWEPLSYLADGVLHRWITLDSWGEDDLSRELHSWRVIGDVAVTKLPLVLHVIEIGQTRNGRRATAWVRAWKHPAMPSLQMRFRKKDGKEFKGYLPYHLADHRELDVDAWVEQLWREGAAEELLHELRVNVPTELQCAEVVRDILTESVMMRVLNVESTSWRDLPMSRNACDTFYPCPFQEVCYSGGSLVEIQSMGLYRKRERSAIPVPVGD